MKKVYRTAVISFMFFLMLDFVYGETFRVHNSYTAVLTDEPISVKMGVNDSLSIVLPADRTFLQAVSIDIKIPREVAAYRDSVAYSVYRGVSPVPSSAIIDYSGSRQLISTFPGRLSWNILIPAKQNHSLKSSPYSTVLPFYLDQTDQLVFFRLQLVMKGVPIDFDSVRFTAEIKPVYSDEGYLILEIVEPPETVMPDYMSETEQTVQIGTETVLQPAEAAVQKQISAESAPLYTVYIDNNSIKNPLEKRVLSAGVHHVSIVSDKFRSEVRTVTVSKAASVTEKIQLRDITPTLLVAAPESAQIFLNEKPFKYAGTVVPVPEGDHLVRIMLGDYESVRKFTAVNGKSYTVSVTVDMLFSEE